MPPSLTVAELPLIFSDITPIPQNDGPVCRIDYRPDFKEAHDYMRAILAKNERTERALQLTGLCLSLNAANYTVWHYRRIILMELGLTEEVVNADLEFASDLGGPNPKNYQIAFHRRALLEALGMSETRGRQELEYIATVLNNDSKNYHMWSSRQWILSTVDAESLWEEEKAFVENLLLDDVRNNSAWNERWFVVHRGKKDSLRDEDVCQQELDYALEMAKLDPYNESPWRYMIGLVKERNDAVKDGLLEKQIAEEIAQVLVEAERDVDACANFTSARIDLLQRSKTPESLATAIGLCKSMESEHDVIRHKYWKMRASEIEKLL